MRLAATTLAACLVLGGCSSPKTAAAVVGVTGLFGALTTGAAIAGACAGGCGASAVPYAALGGGASLALIGVAYALSRTPSGAAAPAPEPAPIHRREDVPIL